MKEISQYNINTREYEVIGNINVDMGICFVTDLGRYDVTIDEETGGIKVQTLALKRSQVTDQISISPLASNVVHLVMSKRQQGS